MKKKYLLIISLLLIIFIFITTLVVTNNISNFDENIYRIIFSIRNDFWDIFFTGITTCANTITVLCVVVLLLLMINNEEKDILGVAIIITVLMNQGFKYLFGRIRPDHLKLIKQGGYSYPSGHAMISVCLYGFLIYYTYHNITNKYLKIIIITLLSLLIILIGISRVYLGVHYPSDVLGGYVLSLLILILVVLGVEKYGKNGSK